MLSHHARQSLHNALASPAASEELIRVIERLMAFAEKFPVPEGETLKPADEPAKAEPAKAPETGVSVTDKAEATVVKADPAPAAPDAPAEAATTAEAPAAPAADAPTTK